MPEQNIDIPQQLDKLISLQEVDFVIYKLNTENEKKPVIINELKQKIDSEKQTFEQSKNALNELLLRRKEKEGDLEVKETEIKKLTAQLYQLKTNKEYDAMQLQIKGLQADVSVLEEDILMLMDKTEAEQSTIKDRQAQSEQKQQEFSAEIKKIEQEIKSIEDEIAKQSEKRKQLSQGIDQNILSRYQRILEGKNGLAIVPIDGDSCSGCNMQLPAQVINEIRLKKEIIYCGLCSRMLYDKDF